MATVMRGSYEDSRGAWKFIRQAVRVRELAEEVLGGGDLAADRQLMVLGKIPDIIDGRQGSFLGTTPYNPPTLVN